MTGTSCINYVAQKMPCVEQCDIAAVVAEWQLHTEEKISKAWYKLPDDDSCKEGDGTYKRVDTY